MHNGCSPCAFCSCTQLISLGKDCQNVSSHVTREELEELSSVVAPPVVSNVESDVESITKQGCQPNFQLFIYFWSVL